MVHVAIHLAIDLTVPFDDAGVDPLADIFGE